MFGDAKEGDDSGSTYALENGVDATAIMVMWRRAVAYWRRDNNRHCGVGIIVFFMVSSRGGSCIFNSPYSVYLVTVPRVSTFFDIYDDM